MASLDAMKRLVLCLLALAVLVPAAACADRRVVSETGDSIGDRVNYTRGRYLAYAGPWSTFSMPQKAWTRGVEYEDTLTIDPAAFKARGALLITYRWPDKGCSTGVCGYMVSSIGNYDGGKPEIPTTPRQVAALKTFRQKFNLEHVSGDRQSGAWLTEFYLTSEPGRSLTRTAEIGFFPHATLAARAYAMRQTSLGDWKDPSTGRTWKVYQHPGGGAAKNYFMFFTPLGDYMQGSIDMKAALGYLEGLGKIDGRHWINGVAMGIETHHGAGQGRIKSWTVEFD